MFASEGYRGNHNSTGTQRATKDASSKPKQAITIVHVLLAEFLAKQRRDYEVEHIRMIKFAAKIWKTLLVGKVVVSAS